MRSNVPPLIAPPATPRLMPPPMTFLLEKPLMIFTTAEAAPTIGSAELIAPPIPLRTPPKPPPPKMDPSPDVRPAQLCFSPPQMAPNPPPDVLSALDTRSENDVAALCLSDLNRFETASPRSTDDRSRRKSLKTFRMSPRRSLAFSEAVCNARAARPAPPSVWPPRSWPASAAASIAA